MTPAEEWGLLWRPLKSNISHLCTLTAALSHVTHLPCPHNCTSMKIPQCTWSVFLCTLVGLLKVVDVVDFLNSTVALRHLPRLCCKIHKLLTILHSEWNLSRIQNLACNYYWNEAFICAWLTGGNPHPMPKFIWVTPAVGLLLCCDVTLMYR